MTKNTLLTLGIAAVIPFTVTLAVAQQDKPKKPIAEASGHSHFTKIPATVPEIWKEIRKQQGKLAAVVAEKDLGEAHDHAFAIRDLVLALPARISTENKAKTETAAKEIVRIAAAIDKSGAAGAQKSTESNVKKLDAAVAALRLELKAE